MMYQYNVPLRVRIFLLAVEFSLITFGQQQQQGAKESRVAKEEYGRRRVKCGRCMQQQFI